MNSLRSIHPLRIQLIGRRAFSCTPRRQSHAAAAETVELTEPATYVSTSTDIYFNLSFEDWLLRHTPRAQPILFLYRNEPCVVIGRNQNPWQESTPRVLRELGLPMVRRRSGGGTVYHDLGNTNFSIVLPRLAFTRSAGAELVSRAVRERLGVPPCTTNARHDIVVRPTGEAGAELKVSGSAYKIIQHRAYHHGTMLISSDLGTLGRALRSSSPNMVSRGVASVRVPVGTLNAHRAPGAREITHGAFVAAAAAEFGAAYGPSQVQAVDEAAVFEGGHAGVNVDAAGRAAIRAGMAELQSWDWEYGQTPAFSNHFEGALSCGRVRADVESRHGLVTAMTLEILGQAGAGGSEQQDADQDALERIAHCCLGLRYEGLDGVGTFLGDSVRPDLSWEVVSWLQSHM